MSLENQRRSYFDKKISNQDFRRFDPLGRENADNEQIQATINRSYEAEIRFPINNTYYVDGNGIVRPYVEIQVFDSLKEHVEWKDAQENKDFKSGRRRLAFLRRNLNTRRLHGSGSRGNLRPQPGKRR